MDPYFNFALKFYTITFKEAYGQLPILSKVVDERYRPAAAHEHYRFLSLSMNMSALQRYRSIWIFLWSSTLNSHLFFGYKPTDLFTLLSIIHLLTLLTITHLFTAKTLTDLLTLLTVTHLLTLLTTTNLFTLIALIDIFTLVTLSDLFYTLNSYSLIYSNYNYLFIYTTQIYWIVDIACVTHYTTFI